MMSAKKRVMLYAGEVIDSKGGKSQNVGMMLEFDRSADLIASIMYLLEQVEVGDFDELPKFIPAPVKDFRDKIIQILEEKFGLKIKVCGNCNNFLGLTTADHTKVSETNPWPVCSMQFGNPGVEACYTRLIEGCKLWESKEVSEKK